MKKYMKITIIVIKKYQSIRVINLNTMLEKMYAYERIQKTYLHQK